MHSELEPGNPSPREISLWEIDWFASSASLSEPNSIAQIVSLSREVVAGGVQCQQSRRRDLATQAAFRFQGDVCLVLGTTCKPLADCGTRCLDTIGLHMPHHATNGWSPGAPSGVILTHMLGFSGHSMRNDTFRTMSKARLTALFPYHPASHVSAVESHVKQNYHR